MLGEASPSVVQGELRRARSSVMLVDTAFGAGTVGSCRSSAFRRRRKMDQERHNWISRRAHEIWQSEGCPNGRDREHWSQAVDDWDSRGQADPHIGLNAVVDHVRSVLVVDDEPLIRFAVVDALEDAVFEVLEAGNADEAPRCRPKRRIPARIQGGR
ncbi:DUF2934 domain-containing protein [Rhizobium leguminosarum]|uniref:DUF2934 domain-containing protein n=2 Tax=Rhizobium TaxID=379 RepID=UPI0032AF8252